MRIGRGKSEMRDRGGGGGGYIVVVLLVDEGGQVRGGLNDAGRDGDGHLGDIVTE